MDMETNKFKCKKCGEEISIEKRAHYCPVGQLHGQRVNRLVIYWPSFPKRPSKQVLEAGYMKRFGSKPVKDGAANK